MEYECVRRVSALAAAMTLACGAPALASADVNEVLGLRASEVVAAELEISPAGEVVAIVPVDGRPVVLKLAPHTVRADSYELWRQRADGSLERVEPGPIRTLRGTVLGFEDTLVAGSLLDDGLHALIERGDDRIWLEPIGDRVAGLAGAYVLYRESDVIETQSSCDALAIPGAVDRARGHALGGGTASGTGLCTAELACDADFEYFQDYGSVANVEARINSVINTANVQYERDVSITHAITAIIVRDTEPDPYSSTDAVTLLNQFRDHWNASQGGITRDVAQLFTGKEINGGTIGIAWLNAVCSSFGYGVVQSDFNNNFSCATDLSAHELGHNWGADHCSCTSNTMNPYITCANVFHPSFTIPEIESFRDSIPCLDCGGAPTGGCCVGAACSITTESDCNVQGGNYLGDGSNCGGDPCAPPPTGGCCVGAACSITTASDCNAQGGDYLGDGSGCAGDPCAPPPATGACCVGTTCTVETEADCNAAGGAYQGDNSDCSGNPCGGGPTEAPLSCINVTTGSLTGGGLADLNASDNSYVTVMSTTSGSKRRSVTNLCADSPFASVASMTLTVETAADTTKVKTQVRLRKTSNGRWTRIAAFTATQSDGSRVITVTDPNRFVDPATGLIEIRIQTEKRNGTHTLSIDQVEVVVTP